jgi:lipopolysaccharide export system protein LptA
MASAVLLALVLAAFIGYGRYRALKAYRQILSRSGVSLTRDSNGVTYSQSVKGRKIFTIRAKTENSLGNGQYALHDAEMLVYNREGVDADHIYASEIEYDENQGIARAKGEVLMDLQPPEGLANGGNSATTNGPETNSTRKRASAPVIHVHTSGLIYLRKLGVAATDQQVNFSYGDMTCTALGAEFNSGQNTIHLLANVRMDGLARGKPLQVIATRADMDRNANVALLTHPVITSDGRRAKADRASLNLRKDGSVEHLEGIGHVVLTAATRQVTASRLDATLNPQSIPETAKLSGDVALIDSDSSRPTQGSATVVDLAFDAKGSPTTIVATGGAKLSMVDRRTGSQGLARSMDGEKITALFKPGERKNRSQRSVGSQIKEIHITGSAHASGESVVRPAESLAPENAKTLPLKKVLVAADDLRIVFTPSPSGSDQPQTLTGVGHTQLRQDAPMGEQEYSSGDNLQMTFAQQPDGSPAGGADKAATSISNALQTGHVSIRDRAATKAGSTATAAVSTAAADRAVFDGATQLLTLTGNASFYGDNASLNAPTVSIDQRTQNADATGGIQVTFQNAAKSGQSPAFLSSKPAAVTHILAASAHFEHATRLAMFYGTDNQPARMWQDASQVQAATLLFDGLKRTFSARPANPGNLIHAIFASNPTAIKPGKAELAASILRVASPRMDYNDLQHEATFSGGVTIEGTMGEVRGQHAAVFLASAAKPVTAQPFNQNPAATLQAQPSPFSGSIDRVVVYSSVQLDEPGRHGTGDQLLYTAATGSYVLTGTPSNPPHIVDVRQGDVTGAMLLFSNAGSTIVVAGDPSAPSGKGGRVRSETHVSPGKEERQ